MCYDSHQPNTQIKVTRKDSYLELIHLYILTLSKINKEYCYIIHNKSSP